MLSLRIIPLVILVAVLVQYASGNQRIVHVSQLISDDEDFITSGEDDNSHICCVYGSCPCSSLDHALANLTSNVLINITTDVTLILSSFIKVSDIENVTIIGHNNPTVNCEDFGRIHLNFCNNCIIQGITWDGCGSVDIDHHIEPVLKLSNSSNITINNCSFQYSKGQAVLLSEVSGDVNIDHCNFVHNNHYGGHGAAIHYSSSNVTNCHQLSVFTIFGCNFAYNYAKSLVYIENTISRHNVTIHYTKFCHNQGVSVYAVSQNIYLTGKNVFHNNTAKNGTAIHISDHATVIFSENSDVTFTQNFAKKRSRGGAVFLRNHSNVIFDQNSVTVFNDNIAYLGGAIYSEVSSNITFKANCKVTFSNNSAVQQHWTDWSGGGAMYSKDNCYITFEGNSSTVFSNNTAAGWCGGAICSEYSDSYILFERNSSTVFSKNIAPFGGAIYSESYIHFEGNSSTEFSNNTAQNDGGAILSYSYILFEGNSSTVFSNNIADLSGGVILSYSYIIFEGNSSTMFSTNIAEDGGAILSFSYILFEGNSSTVFSNNIAGDDGGAIAIYSTSRTNVSFEGFSTVVFRNNIAEYGGAVFATDDIIFSDNSAVTFTNNKATFGETVFSRNNSKVIANGNSTVTFNDLSAKWCNNTCLPYTGQGDVVTIDSNGIVWCSDQKLLICLIKKCYCNKLEHLLDGLRSNTLVNITGTVTLSTVVQLEGLDHISIIGYNNITVICINSGGLKLDRCIDVTIEGITWIGCGGYDNINYLPVISLLTYFKNIFIQKCTFQYSLGIAISGIFKAFQKHNIKGVTIKHCNFMNNNQHKDHGAAIHIENPAFAFITINIINCTFSCNGIAKSIIHFGSTNHRHLNNIYFNYPVRLKNIYFYNNQGVSVYLSRNTHLHVSGDILFENNVAENGAGIYISDHSIVTFDSNAKLVNNSAYHNGAAIFASRHSNVIFEQSSVVTFNDNTASNGTVYCEASSNVTFKANCNVTFNSNSVTQYGAAVYSFDNSHVTFTGNSKVTFNDNTASNGTVYCEASSNVTFKGNCNVTFNRNSVTQYGAAVYSFDNSHVTFTGTGNSKVTFNDNTASNGTVYCEASSNVTFKGNCNVTFSSNSATQYGAAIYSFDNSHVTFTKNSKITFSSNIVSSNDIDLQHSGTIYSGSNSYISFEDNSVTMFSNNIADYGAAIFSFSNSNIIFKDNSRVTFNNNTALYCGVLTSVLFSSVIYKDNTKVSYNTNTVSCTTTSTNYESSAAAASVMCTSQNTEVIFLGHSLVTYTNNTGGTLVFSNSSVIVEEYSTVTFKNNIAQYSSGGAFICYNNSYVTIKGNSTVTFNSNKASQNGGALYSYNMCKITFKENSTSTFIKNAARNNGGAMFSSQFSEITIEGNSTITFNDNTAYNGGAFYFANSNITITETSMVSLYNNNVRQEGGAGYLSSHCIFIIEENAKVTFDDNKAFHGGAICTDMMSKLIFKGNSTTSFHKNLGAENGGAVTVLNNSSITVKYHVTIKFTDNSAQYGGAIFLDTTATMVNNSDIDFKNNFARILGSSVYEDVAELCNSSCLYNRITGVSNKIIATPPNQLRFYDPATCVDNDNDTQCKKYYVKSIMLGREIAIPVCVLDYYNQTVDSTQFLVHETYPNNSYSIKGAKQVVISCDMFEGISIIGNQSLYKSTNFSITITLNTALYSDWRQISVNLTIELSPCHPGFWQYPNSTECKCYNANDIMFCSGSSSTIKRGYWFGSVTGKPTVTFCPINYCNFTCCETSNGYYHLSPVRENQCRSHRSGTACGSCEEGYTLSFDSSECINVKDCSAGETILLLALILLYWILIIVAVFSIMHFKVGIGYLYAITYYYSVVDLLLNQIWYLSSGLNTTINVMSSFAKIIPQFLGQLCFTTNMSGIDQQFIHYIHPVAISLFLVMITMLSRRSRRLSNFISKGIIHVICCLLLLSYTSLATTSLLLMRPLIFHDIDKAYTYVSPDIEYFRGRHLAYAIVAVLFTVVIVIGLPLLLALEPFLNSKINFVKIKPLLDQFQGCYKDKYRCFAAYYMICRLVIITIVIANSSNDFIFRYLLIIASVIMELIHQILRPYSNSLLNVFDGIILHLLVLVSVLPLVEFFNSFNSNLVVGMAISLVILPLLIFTTMSLTINKEKIRKLPGYCYIKCSQLQLRNHDEIPLEEAAESSDEDEYVNIIDDSRRVNATICDV